MNIFQIRRWINQCNQESVCIFLSMLDEGTKDYILDALQEDQARILKSFAELVRLEDFDTKEIISRMSAVLDSEKSPKCIEEAKANPPVIPNDDHVFSREDIALALDYSFDRRPLNKFEEERGRRVHEKIEELMDYIENTPLY